MSSQQLDLPLLPLRDVVVYPHMVLPLFVGRDKSIKALQSAMDGGKEILLVAQKVAGEDEPRAGTVRRWHRCFHSSITQAPGWNRESPDRGWSARDCVEL